MNKDGSFSFRESESGDRKLTWPDNILNKVLRLVGMPMDRCVQKEREIDIL